MAPLNSKTADYAHDLLDYAVVDQHGDSIGTLHSFWADAKTGQLEFIGVKTGWLFGHNHVIPIDKVEMDDATRTVRVPYTSEFVKEALSIDADATISDAQEAEIYRYYNLQGQTGHSATAMHETSHHETNVTTAATGVATGLAATGAAVSHAATEVSHVATETSHAMTGKDTIEVPLTEEQLRVGKRTVEAGAVRLRKIVRTEVVNQPVEIRHEDVVVERVSADQVHAGTVSDFKEEVIDVPLTREEVVVQKDAHVTGAVRLHKTEGVEQQNVSETVRKEDVEVLRDGETLKETHEVRK